MNGRNVDSNDIYAAQVPAVWPRPAQQARLLATRGGRQHRQQEVSCDWRRAGHVTTVVSNPGPLLHPRWLPRRRR